MLSSNKCCVPECINRRAKSKRGFHKIPRNKLLAQKWLETINNPELIVLKSARVCARHFERRQYKNFHKNMLKEGVIPVLFMPKATNAKSTNHSDVEQFKIVHNTLEKRFVANNSVKDTTLEEMSSNKIEPESSSNHISVSKSYDFKNTCRICLLEKDDLKNMDSEFIRNMFQSCNVLEFSDRDTYPKKMCEVCLEELKITYSFSKKCAKSSYVSCKYSNKADNTNSERISGENIPALSKTVEVSYVPLGDEMHDNENANRSYEYTLVAVDGIEKSDLSSLFSIDREKDTSSVIVETVKPVMSSTIQTYEVQSSENPRLTDVTTTNSRSFHKQTRNTPSLENNPTIGSNSATNKTASDANIIPENRSFVEKKYVEENSRDSTKYTDEVGNNNRVLRKRKFSQIVPVTNNERQSLPVNQTPTTPVCVLPTVQTSTGLDKSPDQDASEPVTAICQQTEPIIQDFIQETVEYTARSPKRQPRTLSRTAGRESRSNRSNTRTRKRPQGLSSRKTVSSGDAVYWYDKTSTDSVADQLDTMPLVNRIQRLRTLHTAGDYKLLGFDQTGQSVVTEFSGNTTESSAMIKTASNTASGKITVDTGSAKVSAHSEKNETASENTFLKGQSMKINTDEEKSISGVNIPKRGRGRPGKITVLPTAVLDDSKKNETPSENTFLKCQSTKLNTDEEKSNNVVNIPKRGRGRPRKITVLPTAVLDRVLPDSSEPRTSNIVSCTSKINKNDQCNHNSDNTGEVISETDECNIKNSITTKCNNKRGNSVRLPCTKKIKTTKRNSKTDTVVRNITANNNTTLDEQQIHLAVSQTDNINGNTAQHVLPTEEQVTGPSARNDCQHNRDKITKQNKSINIGENDDFYMKLRHKNVKFNVNSQQKRLQSLNVNIEHLDISKKEVNRLLNVKLELNQFKIKNNSNKGKGIIEDSTKINGTANESKKKVEIFNKPTFENIRVLRSSKQNRKSALTCSSNSENIKLTKDVINLKSTPPLNANIVDKELDIKTTVENVSESNKVPLCLPQKEELKCSSENIQPTAHESLENIDKCSVNKVDEIICCAGTDAKDETALMDYSTGQDTAKPQFSDTFAQNSGMISNAKVKIDTEFDRCLLNIKTELSHKYSADSKRKVELSVLDTKVACLPNSKVENKSSLESTTACDKYSPESKVDNITCLLNIEHAYSMDYKTEYEAHSLNSKTEYDSKTELTGSLANNDTEHDTYVQPDNEKTPEAKPVDDFEIDPGTKDQIIELLTEFMVFPIKDDDSCMTEQNDGIREFDTDAEHSTKNYYQLLNGTNHCFTGQEDKSPVIHTDAMLSNVQNVSPELKAGVPTMSDDKFNESFEKTINNIFNTEYNSICDGQLVGSGIVLDDVASEEALPTAANEPEPVLHQQANENSPRFRINCRNVYFNKRSGMIVTALPAEETENYSSEDEYYSNRFHSAWLPVVQLQLPADSSDVLFDNVIVEPVAPYASNASDIVIKHSGVVIPAQQYNTAAVVDEQHCPYQCRVCNAAFQTNEQLISHMIYAHHVTKRFCKRCKQLVDIGEYETHVKRHEIEEVFCCEYCGLLIYELKRFTRHRRIHRRHQCQLCTMQFDTKFLLSQHLTVHTGVRRDLCKHCGRKFCRTSTLITHLAARTCLKEQCECNICNRKFTNEKFCRNHLRLVHGITENA